MVHYSSLAHYKRHRQNVTLYIPGPDGTERPRSRTFGTDRILTREGCRGFDNPLRGYEGPAKEE